MKYEWRKNKKNLYQIKSTPTLLTVEKQNYIMLDGKGNPNEEVFSEKISALYSLAYAIKMNYKKQPSNPEYEDFTVFPLEGLWKKENEGELIKSELSYTIMIAQPDFITKEIFEEALAIVTIKKPNPFYKDIRFSELKEGLSLSMLHIGPFDNEQQTFDEMESFYKLNNLKRVSEIHREIYLNNLHRTDPSKLKTILRYQVEKN